MSDKPVWYSEASSEIIEYWNDGICKETGNPWTDMRDFGPVVVKDSDGIKYNVHQYSYRSASYDGHDCELWVEVPLQ